MLDLLRGVSFAVEGSGWLLPTVEGMARDLGGRPVRVPPEGRALYHATAVMACGHVAALLRVAASLWGAFGYPPEDALAALLPLARGTVEALEREGLPRGVTGPVVRGDVGTLRRHLEALSRAHGGALEAQAPPGVALYSALALASLEVARERGVPEARLREMEAALRGRPGVAPGPLEG